jgi:hypothetical protein
VGTGRDPQDAAAAKSVEQRHAVRELHQRPRSVEGAGTRVERLPIVDCESDVEFKPRDHGPVAVHESNAPGASRQTSTIP